MGPALRGAAVIQGGQSRPPLQSKTGAVRNGTSRTPSPTKSQGACLMGGQRRPPLQSKTGTARSGTSRTACPTHSVIARSEATRRSVLPSPKRRIPAPVCTPRALASRRALARNDSAPRWERRDTWVPPYGVRRSSRAGGGVRPYKAKQEPRKTGRRGRRPLRNHKGCVQRGGQRRPPLQGRTGAVRNGTSGTASPTKSQGVCAMGGQGRPPL